MTGRPVRQGELCSSRAPAPDAATPAVRCAGLSDTGRVRPNNEDRWFADPAEGIYLVSDGMGGQSAGELAAHLVAHVLPGKISKAMQGAGDSFDSEAVARVAGAIAELSRSMWRESDGQPGVAGMGATLVLAVLRGRQALVAHMGDSRAYLCREAVLQCLTRDHTMAELLLDARALTPEEAAVHPSIHQLTRFVGMPGEPRPGSRVITLLSGDRLLLCSDGLSGSLDHDRLSEIVAGGSDPDRICRRLIDAANAAGGKDNITAVLLMVS